MNNYDRMRYEVYIECDDDENLDIDYNDNEDNDEE
jgi:hypothetical protein